MELLKKNYKRIVVKVGSSLFHPVKEFNGDNFFDNISRQLVNLIKDGKELVVVSSGAITLGSGVLSLKERPKDISSLQAIASVGQNVLMDKYSAAFKKGGVICAQLLLTWDDFSDRKRYLNAKNTIITLFRLGSLPVINENDTVSTEEIKFGDNDRLSALVATLINADLLIILSDVDGLLDNKNNVVRIVDEINNEVKSLACPTKKKMCVGGMITKIEAADIAVKSGIPAVIANGRNKDVISSIVDNPASCGTVFLPKKTLGAKERWLAFGTKPKGKIVVDDGAKKALLNHKSLLSVGIIDSHGAFGATDIVKIVDRQGNEFARGKVSLASSLINDIKGRRYDKEVIHSNNIVLLV